jgi:glyceraldehyde 3-phosphate dehydrogenase
MKETSAMSIKVGINGFGRIGRAILRILQSHPDIEVKIINDLASPTMLAHLFKYDSVHRIAPQKVEAHEDKLIIDGKAIQITAHKNPEEIPWKNNGVDIVLECTGIFTSREACLKHIQGGGAKKVILSAPGKGMDKTLVMGVNHNEYDFHSHQVVSNGSCTTNCLAPLAKVLHESFGIESGLMTTIHSYTNDQRVLDVAHSDPRRARAAALNMIPTTTGAAKAISEVIPSLAGKLNGFAVRVPTPNVSVVDLTVTLQKDVTVEDLNHAFKEASEKALKGILGFSTLPLVSSDFNGNPLSSIVDAEYTTVISKRMVKVLSWYDNEWGFSNRMVDLLKLVATGR